MLLKLIQCVLTPEGTKCTFEVVDQCSGSVCVCAIGTDSRPERDIMIDRRFFLCPVCEIRFLTDTLVRAKVLKEARKSRALTYLSIPVVGANVVSLLAELKRHNLMHDGVANMLMANEPLLRRRANEGRCK